MWGTEEGGVLNYSEGIGENWVLEQSLLKAHKIAVRGGPTGLDQILCWIIMLDTNGKNDGMETK